MVQPDSTERPIAPLAASTLTRPELLKLHEQFALGVNEQLRFCFDYLNFYVALLSAILAAVVTGLFQFKPRLPEGLVLLVGPALMVWLAWTGYATVKVFYRRMVEAWITSMNLESMLGLRDSPEYEAGVRPPTFPSRYGRGS